MEKEKRGYLVISRKIGERIQIGDDIEILIADIHQGKADVAIKAPKEVLIAKKGRHIDDRGKK